MNGNSSQRNGTSMWFRWAWRDLKGQWLAVVAIGLVLAIGTGVFAGLGSTATWRRLSNDASFAALYLHDVRFELSPGTFAPEGSLVEAVSSSGVADAVEVVEERLVVDSQIDTTPAVEGAGTLVAARLVGMDLSSDVAVDRLWVRDGSAPVAGVAAAAEAIVEVKFADAVGMDTAGTLLVAGGRELAYSGLGVIPEDYYYEGPPGALFSLGELAPVYLHKADLQALVGREGQVNDLVVRLADGADSEAVISQIGAVLDESGLSYTATTYDEEYAVRVLYDDIESDQQVWNMISGLILGAAALAAFNLINRIVEAQRREIGIGMALGVDRRKLAIRPMMIGLQVAIVGTVAGIGVGLLIGDAMKGLFNSFLPLPDYRTPFQFAVFARAALLAVAIPLLAAAVPVWRALRVEPIEAIRLGHLAAKQSRFGDWTGRLRLPGSTFTLMPVRNLVRTPRRTVLTALGVGAAVTTLVAVFGLLDTFGRTISLVGEELTGADRDRVVVQLDTFYPEGAGVVAAVEGSSAVEVADRGIRLPVVAAKRSEGDITMLIDLVDLDVARWQPTLLQGDGSDGLIVAEKAAEDLGIGVGDTVAVTHPTIDDSGQFGLDTSQLRVSGVHANPVRTFAYMDIGQASAFGMAGLTNLITVYPPEGLTWIDIQRDLFGSEGVSSVQGMARLGDSFDEYLEEFVSILLVAAGAVLVLALLISFNATRITVDERRREHATMRAFGLPVRSVLFGVVKESVLIGVLATLIGIAGGYAFLTWMVSTLMETTVPELSMQARLSVATLGWAALVGIAAMAIAPLFVIRRLHKMNIPDTLRVME